LAQTTMWVSRCHLTTCLLVGGLSAASPARGPPRCLRVPPVAQILPSWSINLDLGIWWPAPTGDHWLLCLTCPHVPQPPAPRPVWGLAAWGGLWLELGSPCVASVQSQNSRYTVCPNKSAPRPPGLEGHGGWELAIGK